MPYSDIIKNTSHISEKEILKRTKVKEPFIPLREALCNSLEAIKLKNRFNKESDDYKGGKIDIEIQVKEDISKSQCLDYIKISDNGIGFNSDNFRSFCRYMDASKGFNNKGTGRFYLINFFKEAVYSSVFSDQDGSKKYGEFSFSSVNPSSDLFIKIIKDNEDRPFSEETKTSVVLYPFEENIYEKYAVFLDVFNIKEWIIDKFLLEFLLHREQTIPTITITSFFKGKNETVCVSSDNIPQIDKEEDLFVPLYKINYDKKIVEETNENISFKLYSVKNNSIKKNGIILTSSNQKIESFPFQGIFPDDNFNKNKIILFVKSKYLDNPEIINEERKKFNFFNKSDLEKELKKSEKQGDFNFSHGSYLLKDVLMRKVNNKALKMYPEIENLKKQKENTAYKLKNRFLISDKIFNKVTKNLNAEASPEEFLMEFYKAEAEILAKSDIEISNKFDEILNIDPSSKDCIERFNNIAKDIIQLIPIQNRNNLAQYVARRQLVLKAFENILNQNYDFSIKEKHLHNLFLTQGKKNNASDSNLWMLNEDFIYFSGKSEERLCDFKIKGKKLFKKEITEEENRYLLSLGENRKWKKPDILLFPEENKAIIIEFKNIDINLSDHLYQINKYAYWLRNFTEEEFELKQFYGYLIGEGLEYDDIVAADSDFKKMYNGKVFFRPKKTVIFKSDESRNGELYTEIFSYSELLQRAETRNKIFIEKLGLSKKQNKNRK